MCHHGGLPCVWLLLPLHDRSSWIRRESTLICTLFSLAPIFFHMFDCLGTVYHNVRRLDNDNITATVLQCSFAQWDSSVQIFGISRSHVVLHKLDTAFSLYCGRSWIHQRFSLIAVSRQRLYWLLVVCFACQTMHCFERNSLKLRLLYYPFS